MSKPKLFRTYETHFILAKSERTSKQRLTNNIHFNALLPIIFFEKRVHFILANKRAEQEWSKLCENICYVDGASNFGTIIFVHTIYTYTNKINIAREYPKDLL